MSVRWLEKDVNGECRVCLQTQAGWTKQNLIHILGMQAKRRYELTDAQWARLEPLLPPEKPWTGRPNDDHRQILNGILWVLNSGAPWRDLPRRYGPVGTVSGSTAGAGRACGTACWRRCRPWPTPRGG